MADLTRVETSIKEAFATGALKGAGFVPKGNAGFGARFFNVDFAQKCDAPISATVEGALPEYGVPARYRTQSSAKYRDHTEGHLSVQYLVPCRACGPCLRYRAWRWATAAELEIRQSAALGGRTWFGTLTLSPQSHFEMLMRGERIAGHVLVGAEEEFPFRHAAVSRELTLALKRIRKRKGRNAFRYFLVCEKHQSGLPHYHMLLHELAATVRKSELNEFWPWGFSQWRLVTAGGERRGARYVAKYLSKDASARVRASQGYGGEPTAWSALANSPSAREPAKGVADVNTAPETRGQAPRLSEVYPGGATAPRIEGE